jgi:hypothetical protein
MQNEVNNRLPDATDNGLRQRGDKSVTISVRRTDACRLAVQRVIGGGKYISCVDTHSLDPRSQPLPPSRKAQVWPDQNAKDCFRG